MRAQGLAPEELESRVTAPVEIAVRGVPNLVSMRSTTRYSLALITFEFAEGTDIYWARAQVNERLQEVRDMLPDGTEGGLAPIVTPLAEMLMFTVESPSLSVQEIRSLIDWTIRPRLRGLPGVADVNVLGGYVRIFEVVPSAAAMAARSITTQTLEKQQQQDHDEQRGLDQDLLHRPDRFFDQVVAIVEDRDFGPLRQYLFNLRQPFLDTADDGLGVGAAQSQYRGPDGLGLAIHRNRAVARQRAFAHLRNIADPDGHVRFLRDHGAADIIEGMDATLRAYHLRCVTQSARMPLTNGSLRLWARCRGMSLCQSNFSPTRMLIFHFQSA
jgi:hypothetical protein